MVQALIKGMKKIIEGNRIGGEGCFSGDSMVNKPPANAGDMGLIPDPGDPLMKETATHSSIAA